ncbi:MAG TPA: cupredoxin domain-containing protein [Candidatus Acidoferrales bacterium]|nr:cupredoxin domain-containing protein [Candidatus Acidoferrales bacterium]
MSPAPVGARAGANAQAAALAGALALLAASCAPSPAARYQPQVRELTLTAVPLLVREQEHLFPFLHADFAPHGILADKEVYAFVPPSLTVIEGDTLHLTIVNPEDDAHEITLPGDTVVLPGQMTTRVTYVAPRAGIYPLACRLPTHAPFMAGQLVVLAPSAVARGGGSYDAVGR